MAGTWPTRLSAGGPGRPCGCLIATEDAHDAAGAGGPGDARGSRLGAQSAAFLVCCRRPPDDRELPLPRIPEELQRRYGATHARYFFAPWTDLTHHVNFFDPLIAAQSPSGRIMLNSAGEVFQEAGFEAAIGRRTCERAVLPPW